MISLVLVTPLNFENEAQKELFDKFEIESNRFKGGISFECDESLLKALHENLRVPIRILLPFFKAKVTDFPKLFKRAQKPEWNTLLYSLNLDIKVTCKKSRIIHSDRASDTIKKAILEFHRKNNLKNLVVNNPKGQTIYVRIVDDYMTISLDLSGEPLYKRGIKEYVGSAPIRENLAYTLLMQLKNNNTTTLISPMSGSGTFITEALCSNSRDNFSYIDIPIFKKINMKNIAQPPLFTNAIGIERNEQQLNQLKKNIKGIPNIKILESDFFETILPHIKNSVSIINPPYGIRLKIENPVSFYKKILNHLSEQKWSKRIGIIIPKEFSKTIPKRFKNYRLIKITPFKNGGLDVQFFIFEDEQINSNSK